MNEDRMREAYQDRKSPPPGSAPPTPDELAALVAGTGGDAERLEILDRALSHPESARQLELLRAISAAEQAEAPSLALRRWVPLALAATVTLAISATLLVVSLRRSEVLRAPPPKGAPLPVAPNDAAVQAAGTVSFVWRPVPKAAGYRFELLSEAGTVITTKSTADTVLAVGVPDPGPYRWVVVALLPDGLEVLSRPRRLRITP